MLEGMKAVILAGGFGTRIAEESDHKPKPMVEIGGRPILWHIMSHFSTHGVNDFVIAAGYRAYQIKEYFANYFAHNSNFVVDLKSGSLRLVASSISLPPWTVTIVDTGMETQTGGRLLRLREVIGDEDFFLTYGDGLTDADLTAELAFHRSSEHTSTILAVRPPARFARLGINHSEYVEDFEEKPESEGGWINGGFFIFTSEIFSYLYDDATILEKGPLERLAKDCKLRAFKHNGFWMAMDTLRDKRILENLWNTNAAPWVLQK
jgi:glucose-1-phosphate cytidylyltransferase